MKDILLLTGNEQKLIRENYCLTNSVAELPIFQSIVLQDFRINIFLMNWSLNKTKITVQKFLKAMFWKVDSSALEF